MEKFGKSQNVARFEDQRFLTGTGRYVDDIAPADSLTAVFFRSPVAHAEITEFDVAAARGAPGVRLVLTAADLREAGLDIGMDATTVANRDGSQPAAPLRPILAEGRLRHVGEPVAMIVAETAGATRDAAEMIELDFAELDAHVALAPGGPQIHEEAPDNVAFDWSQGDAETTEAALNSAAHRVTMRLADNRIIANPMEPRGAYAEWDGERLHVCVNTQGVWSIKEQLAKALNLASEAVRVTTPDVGGGFGMKGHPYPEYPVMAEAARRLGRPVRWMAERGESMMSDNAGRDLIAESELGFDENLRIVAYRVRNYANLGAYNSTFGQPVQSWVSAKVLPGTYDIRNVDVNVKGIYTNSVQVDAYRGAGRPEAIYTLERSMDNAARQLGVSPWDLRRRNFIAPDAFPYRTAVGELYDVGDFGRVLSRVEEVADVAGFPARRAASRAEGKLRGLGLCYYIEAILGGPTEDAAVEFLGDGTVNLYVGTQSNGQGHETVYKQFLADQTGIPAESITIVQGDSDRIAKGGGTGGSRSVTTQGAATLAAVEQMVAAFRPFLAAELDVAEEALQFEDGAFRAAGTNRRPTLLEAADMARAAGRSDLMRHDVENTLPGRSYPNGAHVCEVEIDPETGTVSVPRYTVTDDFGNLLHPRLVEGQVHGGVAQGIGQALIEQVVHDESGQLLTASFMDYAMPRADDLPMIAFYTEPVPSTANPLGMKGCGEAGTVGALAAVGNAVLDAVWDEGIHKVDMPFTPQRVWSLFQDRAVAAE